MDLRVQKTVGLCATLAGLFVLNPVMSIVGVLLLLHLHWRSRWREAN